MKRFIIQTPIVFGNIIISRAILFFIILLLLFIALLVYFFKISLSQIFYIILSLGCAGYTISRGLKTKSKEYLAELLISDKVLKIVYKKGKETTRCIEVNKDQIAKFYVELSVDRLSISKFAYRNVREIVKLITYDDTIVLKDNGSPDWSFCGYAILLNLLDAAKDIPNFSYQVNGSDYAAIANIEHYAKTGKRLGFLKMAIATFLHETRGNQFYILLLLLLFLVGLGCWIFVILFAFS